MKEQLCTTIRTEDSSVFSLKQLFIRWLSVVSLLIIITIIVTMYSSRSDSIQELSVEYSFSIENDSDSRSFLLVPIPNIPHDIIDGNEIIHVSTQRTEYGEAYNISNSDPVAIRTRGYEKRYTFTQDEIPQDYLGFSLMDNYNAANLSVWDYHHEFWIYSSRASNLSLSFEITLDYSEKTWGNNIQLFFTGNVSQGWNLISPQVDGVTWDNFSKSSDRLPFINIGVVIFSLIYLAYLGIRYENKCIQ